MACRWPCWHWGTPRLTSGQGGRCVVVPKVGDGFVCVSEVISAATSLFPGSVSGGCWLLSCPSRGAEAGDGLQHVLLVACMLLWFLL